jgi:MotA/TolQ/ExbB proton channel family
MAHTRAARLLNAAIETTAVGGGSSPARLATLSFDGFQLASRQFVRALLPFLPLLGFLGTVIGLATAISELPRGLTDGTGHGFDVSASLAGLAVKFETTLLGLMASMLASLALNFLEKRETELAAECMLIVKHAGESDV